MQTAEAHIAQQAVTTHGRDEDREQLLTLRKQKADLITVINDLLEEIRYLVGVPVSATE